MAAFVCCEITTFQTESAAQKSAVIQSAGKKPRTVGDISRVRANNTPNTIHNMSYAVHVIGNSCPTPARGLLKSTRMHHS